jgi:hypothetical protein
MSNQMSDDERYRRAKTRVDQLRGFYIHAAIYVAVNLALLVINLLTSPAILWFTWTLLGWGIGLASHAVVVYGAGALGSRVGAAEDPRTDGARPYPLMT